jgi:hypothetical protein
MDGDLKAADQPAPRRGGGRWLQGMVCGALATLATPTALLAGVLLLPSIIVHFADSSEERGTLRAVLLFGAAGAVAPMLALWTGGHTIDLSLTLLSDITVPVFAWSAQGAGWLLAQGVPLLFGAAFEGQARIEMARLLNERAKIAEQWGLPAPPQSAARDQAS